MRPCYGDDALLGTIGVFCRGFSHFERPNASISANNRPPGEKAAARSCRARHAAAAHAAPAHAAAAGLRAAGEHDVVQFTQLTVAADKMFVRARDVAGRQIGQRDAIQPPGNMPIQPGQALGPRAQISAGIARGVFGVQRARRGVELPQ